MYSTTLLQDPMERVPVSYALLKLPPKRELRKKGFNMADINTTSLRNHPLAKWTTHPLKRGATYRDALDAVEEANKKAWGFLKCRINFASGAFDTYARLDPNDPLTLKHTGTYDPNGVYRAATIEGAVASRVLMLPRLKSLVDDRGHHACAKSVPRSFAPQTLYKECPPPVLSQAGYDFTPMSHNAFLLRPADPSQGVRDLKSDYMKNSCDYRPRSYLRDEVSGGVKSRHCHCSEVYQLGDYTADYASVANTVNHRNRVVVKDFTRTGTLVAKNAVVGQRHVKAPMFPCTHTVGGGREEIAVDDTDAPVVVDAGPNNDAEFGVNEAEMPNNNYTVHFET